MSKSQKKRELSVALKAIRDQMAQPGITAEDRQDLQTELLELEQESYELSHPVAESVDERTAAITKAEELEASGNEKDAAIALSIREAINRTDTSAAALEEEHNKLAQKGVDQLAANKLKIKEDQAERDKELADAREAEMKKAS